MAIEEQGGGSQYVRYRIWPHLRPVGRMLLLAFAVSTVLLGIGRLWPLTTALAFMAGFVITAGVQQCGAAKAAFMRLLQPVERGEPRPLWPRMKSWLARLNSRRARPFAQVPATVKLPTSSVLKLNRAAAQIRDDRSA
jgi:hypothetical protein